MPDWKIEYAPIMRAELAVPGDKSISHRALLLGALPLDVEATEGAPGRPERLGRRDEHGAEEAIGEPDHRANHAGTEGEQVGLYRRG